jgi:hypothetical protein
MKTVKWLVSIGVTFALFATVVKGFTIDGSYEAGYGSALATQVLATTANSGVKNTLGLVDQANGSELDAAYGVIANGTLYLFIAGNIDAGSSGGVAYDKLHVFIQTDSGAGGDHTLGNTYSYNSDFGHPNRMGTGGIYNGVTNDAGSAGLTFDTGFSANWDIEVPVGGGTTVTNYVNLIQICANCPGYFVAQACPTDAPPGNIAVDLPPNGKSGLNTGIQVALNNSNTNGVWGDINGCYVLNGCPTNCAQTVTNGVELAIPLSAIGSPLSNVSVCAFITDDACDKLYNQSLGPVWDGTTDGSYCEFQFATDSSEVNFSTLPGTHHFTLSVPACNSFQISPTTATYPTSVNTGTVFVTACSWTSATSTNWISILSGGSGSGSGTITYSVATNTSINARSASLFVISPIPLSSVVVTQTVTISQDGVTLPPLGAFTVTGTFKPGYGCPLTVQAIGTGYGKSTTTNVGTAGGSELDGAYGLVQNNTLFLLFTGKLESNNNHLHMFFMTGPGGTNTLNSGIIGGQVTNIGGDILNVLGGTTNGATLPVTGLTFDSNFAPNYYMNVNIGNPYHIYLDYAQLWPGGTNASGQCTNGYFVGGSTVLTNGTLIPGHNPFGIQCTVNNNSTNGVDGSSCTTNATSLLPNSVNAALVTNGVELAIPLAAFGSPTGQIAVCAILGGGSGGYMSNQLLPPIAPIGGGCSNNLAGNNNANTVNIGLLPGAPHYFNAGPEMHVTSVTIPAGTTNVAITYLPENNTNMQYLLQRTLAPLATNSTWTPVGSVNFGGPSAITVTDPKAATNKVGVIYRVRQSPVCLP